MEAAKELPDVQNVLLFDRFSVTRFHEEVGGPVVEFFDIRFPQMSKRRTPHTALHLSHATPASESRIEHGVRLTFPSASALCVTCFSPYIL
jgi:hypothetical protein